VILVPRREDGGHRDKLWAHCKALWIERHPDWEIYEGHHNDGPFNRSAAVNLAAEMAGDWDVALIIDSDVITAPDSVEDAVKLAYSTDNTGFRQYTLRVRDLTTGDDLPLRVERVTSVAWAADSRAVAPAAHGHCWEGSRSNRLVWSSGGAPAIVGAVLNTLARTAPVAFVSITQARRVGALRSDSRKTPRA